MSGYATTLEEVLALRSEISDLRAQLASAEQAIREQDGMEYFGKRFDRAVDREDALEVQLASARKALEEHVLMPREATRTMTMAGCDSLPSCEHVFGHAGEMLRNAYRRMVEVGALSLTDENGKS